MNMMDNLIEDIDTNSFVDKVIKESKNICDNSRLLGSLV